MSKVYQMALETTQYDDSCVMAIDSARQKSLVFLKNGVHYAINIDECETLVYEDGQFWPVDEEYLKIRGYL